MEKRRERIVSEARNLLAEGGFHQLNLRNIAQAAEVTVPTIYNLIGNKAALLQALVANSYSTYELMLKEHLPCPAADLPAIIVRTFEDMVSQDVSFHRASQLAIEYLCNDTSAIKNRAFSHPFHKRLGQQILRKAANEGLLLGNIDRNSMIDLMFTGQQASLSAWAHQQISLKEMGKRSLRTLYIVLAADANEEFKKYLTGRLAEISVNRSSQDSTADIRT